MSFPTSVGQATHSLADTAARQTNVGKLCTAFYQSVADPNAVITNKHDFKAVREEIALSIGRAYNEVLGVSPGSTCKGPIPVITNIAPLSGGHPNDLMSWYIRFFDCRSLDERREHARSSCIVRNQTYFPSELNFAGFIMNHNAMAHPTNGDPAVTLFIGGIITIKNGRYPIAAADDVQWYFEEEADAGMFDENQEGKRTARADMTGVPQLLDRDSFRMKTHNYGERAFTKRIVYVKSCKPGLDGRGCTLGDMHRRFGVANGDAGPWEKVDIKVSRQSL